MNNKKITVIIIIGILLLLWCGFSVKTIPVEANAGEIVSSKIINIDSTTSEIKVVVPDEIQRLENNRSTQISQLRDEMFRLELRVAKLEKEINP